jgi:hypothetical protein
MMQVDWVLQCLRASHVDVVDVDVVDVDVVVVDDDVVVVVVVVVVAVAARIEMNSAIHFVAIQIHFVVAKESIFV